MRRTMALCASILACLAFIGIFGADVGTSHAVEVGPPGLPDTEPWMTRFVPGPESRILVWITMRRPEPGPYPLPDPGEIVTDPDPLRTFSTPGFQPVTKGGATPDASGLVVGGGFGVAGAGGGGATLRRDAGPVLSELEQVRAGLGL